MRRSAVLIRIATLATLSLCVGTLHAQPKNDKEWQTSTIASDAITIACEDLLLPFEVGHLLDEPNPLGTDTGEMTRTLRSAHVVKVNLLPQTGVTDSLATITGCTVDGTELWLSLRDTGDTITVVHTSLEIELAGFANLVLDHPNDVLQLVRKDARWVQIGAMGAVGGGGAQDFNSVMALGNEYTGADSKATGLIWGDGASKCYNYIGTLGPITECEDDESNPLDTIINAAEGQALHFSIAGTPIETFDSATDTWTYAARAKPNGFVKFDVFSASYDGTLCTEPAEVTYNAVYKKFIINCADDDGSTMDLAEVMPDNWDGGPIELTTWVYNDTGTPNGDYSVDWKAQCRGVGEAGNSTWSAEVAQTFDFDASGSCDIGGGEACGQWDYAHETITITPNGTCTGGKKILVLQGQVNAASTTVDTTAEVDIFEFNVTFLKSGR